LGLNRLNGGYIYAEPYLHGVGTTHVADGSRSSAHILIEQILKRDARLLKADGVHVADIISHDVEHRLVTLNAAYARLKRTQHNNPSLVSTRFLDLHAL